ncbi:tyrosine-type recombinase/integrase, partial [Pseudolactococcus yaeyamensis]
MENIKIGTIWCEPSKTPDKYVWRMRYKNLITLKYEKVSITLTSNTRKAETHAKKLLLEKVRERIETQKTKFQIEKQEQEKILFSKMCDYWHADQAVRVKRSTSFSRSRVVKKLKMDFKGECLQELTPFRIQKYFNDMNYTRKTISTYYSIFRQVMSFAYRMDYLKNDVMKKVRINLPAFTIGDIEVEKKKVFSAKEMKSVLSLMTCPNVKRTALMLEFLFLTGLRYGEFASLTYDDYFVTNDGTYVDINSTLDYQDGGVSMKLHSTPKTVTGNRRVFLSKRAIEIVEFFFKDNKNLLEQSSRFKEYGYIFPSLTGNPKGWTSLDRAFSNFGKRTGLDKKFCIHSLRHSHITLLTEAGVSQTAIMERVGHRDPKITTSIYTHVTKKMSDVAVKELNKIA